MSAFCHDTDDDHGGRWGDDVTLDHTGSPDRLMDTTSQPRPTATLQIRDPAPNTFSVPLVDKLVVEEIVCP